MDPAIEDNHFDYSPYAYVYNNPILFIDPLGEDSVSMQNAEGETEVVNVTQKTEYVNIQVNRTDETDESTIGEFSVDGGKVNGYALEPPEGTAQEEQTEGSNKRIAAGEYAVEEYSSTSFPDHFEITGVPGRTKVLLHEGNIPEDTGGCLLLGSSKAENYVGGSVDKMKDFRSYYKRKKSENLARGGTKTKIKISINNPPPSWADIRGFSTIDDINFQ